MTPNLKALKEKIDKFDYIQILNNVGWFVCGAGGLFCFVLFCYGQKMYHKVKVRGCIEKKKICNLYHKQMVKSPQLILHRVKISSI